MSDANSKKTRPTLEERNIIASFPVYFHLALYQSAIEGDCVKTVGEEMEQDWANFT